ncbi:MarR family transcriptional regulator [Bradyrhizobium sp. SSUT18]|uniref:MarR family winged helix-turn-helix transcriptional regulator n=1 Tax=Bradyrhizobium sp. SSUT18 TaxID=3040602 RepID=UPI00244A43A2|nr:MarR family transcriptional regulator [Bradyrhizobium sp. SSUT18]MDH2406801.1 MarR family transcriptional regulator [Bradyrhizobium sp. SSUT18]
MMDSILRIHGFTTTQYTAMSIIENARSPHSSASLARRLRITPQSANETVASLYDRKLILKKPDPDVPRAKLIMLSAKGRAALAELDREVDKAEAKMLAVLSDDELKTFRQQLRRIVSGSRAAAVEDRERTDTASGDIA